MVYMDQNNCSYPLPPIQFGVIFDFYFSNIKNAYTQQHIWELNEDLDLDAFQLAWNQLIDRHETLRTSFDLVKKTGTIHAHSSISIRHLDWATINPKDVDECFNNFLQQDRDQSLDLSRSPPFRVCLVKIAADQYRLVWTYHHGSFDGRARFLLVKELFLLYQAIVSNTSPELQQPTPYRHYSDWITTLDSSESILYWKKIFQGYNCTSQIDQRIKNNQLESYMNSDQRNIQLSKAEHLSIKSFANSQNVTVSTLVQAAWIFVLAREAEIDDLVIGVIRTCRSSANPELKFVIGLLINVVPIRMKISPHIELKDWLMSLRKQWLSMRDHINIPLTAINKSINLQPGEKLFQTTVMFDTQDETEEFHALGNEWLNRSFRKIENNTVDLELNITAYETMNIMLEYSSERFDIEIIDALLNDFAHILVKMTLDEQQLISTLMCK